MNAPQKAMIQKFLALVTDHIATLEGAGFGGECSINGADAVDAVNDHFEELRDELAKLDRAGFMARDVCTCDADRANREIGNHFGDCPLR